MRWYKWGAGTVWDKISLITTGGTIAQKATANGMLASGALTGHELAALCELPNDIEVLKWLIFSRFQACPCPSRKMQQLKSAIQKELEDPDVTGIVVTHGTDTLEETAYSLMSRLRINVQSYNRLTTFSSRRGHRCILQSKEFDIMRCEWSYKGCGSSSRF